MPSSALPSEQRPTFNHIIAEQTHQKGGTGVRCRGSRPANHPKRILLGRLKGSEQRWAPTVRNWPASWLFQIQSQYLLTDHWPQESARTAPSTQAARHALQRQWAVPDSVWHQCYLLQEHGGKQAGKGSLRNHTSPAAPLQVWILLEVMAISDTDMHVTVCMYRHEGVCMGSVPRITVCDGINTCFCEHLSNHSPARGSLWRGYFGGTDTSSVVF